MLDANEMLPRLSINGNPRIHLVVALSGWSWPENVNDPPPPFANTMASCLRATESLGDGHRSYVVRDVASVTFFGSPRQGTNTSKLVHFWLPKLSQHLGWQRTNFPSAKTLNSEICFSVQNFGRWCSNGIRTAQSAQLDWMEHWLTDCAVAVRSSTCS